MNGFFSSFSGKRGDFEVPAYNMMDDAQPQVKP
jgi:hypothetical protein